MMTRRYPRWLAMAGACVLFSACGPLEEPPELEEPSTATAPLEEDSGRRDHPDRCEPPVLVADLTPGGNSFVTEQLAVGEALFLVNFDILRGTFSLWKLEDVSGGRGRDPEFRAVLLKGDLTVEPRRLVHVGRTLFLTLDDGIHGRELWKSDGTPEGTVLVEDINPFGSAFPDVPLLVAVDRTLYFAADDGTHGVELWRSDGSRRGTRLVEDIAPGSASSSPGPFVVDGHRLLFAADDGTHGRELWRSDGTRGGTRLVEDIHPGPESSAPERLVRLDNHLTFFTADDGEHGRELWRSDGTRGGTRLVEDIRPGPGGSAVESMVAARRTLYFTADDGRHGRELWASEGCEEDTRLVEDIRPGPEGSRPLELTPLGGKVIFTADDGEHGIEPWRSDGTPRGTLLLADTNPGPAVGLFPTFLTAAEGKVFFYAFEPSTGFEPWVTDGTRAGTRLVKDIRPGPGNSISGDPDPIHPIRGGAAFRAFTDDQGSEPWWTDGTEEGTMTADLVPGPGSSSPASFIAAGRWVYFEAFDVTVGSEPWALPLACFPKGNDSH
jgi:ELWxxDGT repeat protein